MNNWMKALFNTGRRQSLFNMMGKRRNNRGMVWASLLGLGVSAVTYGWRRNRNGNMLAPVQNLMNNFRSQNAGQMSKMATSLTEFSKEIVPTKDRFTNK